jgi:hypothetical protein
MKNYNSFILILFGVILLIIFAIVCGLITPTDEPFISSLVPPSATVTQVLTKTPVFTETPTKTNILTLTPTTTSTLTETPTTTPDLAATVAYESTQLAEAQIEEIKKVINKINLSTETGYLGWAEIDPWPITSTSYGTIIFEPIGEGTIYDSYIMHYDVTWKSTSGLAGCGLIFHAEDNLRQG